MVITCWLFVLTSYPAFYLMPAWPSLAACVIEPSGSNQHPEEIRDPLSPADQLVICARASRRDRGIRRGRKAQNEADHGSAAPASTPGAAWARHIDHPEQLILPLGLHSDLWRQHATPAGFDRVHGDPDRWLDSAVGWLQLAMAGYSGVLPS